MWNNFFFFLNPSILKIDLVRELVKIVSNERRSLYGKFMVSRVSLWGKRGSFRNRENFLLPLHVASFVRSQRSEPLWDTFHNAKFDATGDFLPLPANIRDTNLIIHLGNFLAFSFPVFSIRENTNHIYVSRFNSSIDLKKLMIFVIWFVAPPFWNYKFVTNFRKIFRFFQKNFNLKTKKSTFQYFYTI